MKEQRPSLAQLHDMIGLLVALHGRTFRVIEVLDDALSLVLEAQDTAITIQADVHGYAHRQVREVLTIPAADADGVGAHREFLEIDLL